LSERQLNKLGLVPTGQRLKAYLEYKHIGVNQLGRMTNTSGAQISNILTGRNYGVEKLFSVLQVCPDLNMIWLLTGSGEMIPGQQGDRTSKEVPKIAQDSSIDKEVKKLNQEIEALIREKEALQEAVSYKDLSIEVYKHSLEALEATNRELRELLDHYKSMAMGQDNNSRSA